jgi:hypothetical protein
VLLFGDAGPETVVADPEDGSENAIANSSASSFGKKKTDAMTGRAVGCRKGNCV